MKMKNVLQHRLALLWCRVFQVHPKKEIGVGQQGRHQKDVKVLGVQTALSCKRKRANHSLEYLHAARPTRESILLFEAPEERSGVFQVQSRGVASSTKVATHQRRLLSHYSITPRMITSAMLK